MKSSETTIDTGKLLHAYLKKHGINRTLLASRIGRDSQSVTNYSQRNSIQTDILLKICHALEHNFFQDIANSLPEHFTADTELNAGNAKKMADLIEENKVLKIQNEVLMRVRSNG